MLFGLRMCGYAAALGFVLQLAIERRSVTRRPSVVAILADTLTHEVMIELVITVHGLLLRMLPGYANDQAAVAGRKADCLPRSVRMVGPAARMRSRSRIG